MKGPIMRALSGVAAMAMAMGAAPLVAQSGPTDADLMNDAKSTGDVLTYGMGPQAHRFSALNAINSGNVSKMVPVFSWVVKSSAARKRSRSFMTAPSM